MESFDFDKFEVHEHVWELISDLRSGPVFNKVSVCLDCGAVKEITGRIGKANPEIVITD